MADLDDFFAKKDRKKSKGKKFATADEIAKKLEETGRKTEKLKKEKLQTSQIGSQEVDEQGNTVQVKDEDEWREFEEEKKDYSGLKIQNLTVADYDSTDEGGSGGEEEGGMEENEAGEMVPRKKAGPWRVVANAGSEEVKQEEKKPEKPAPEVPQTKSGSYVPPALRSGARQPPSGYERGMGFGGMGRPKVAPDVRNEELFPTLSAANTQEPAASAWGKKKGKEEGGSRGNMAGFEEVKNSRSHTAKYEPPHIAAMRNSSLTLGNKYSALNSEQS